MVNGGSRLPTVCRNRDCLARWWQATWTTCCTKTKWGLRKHAVRRGLRLLPQLAMRYAVGVSEGAPRARTRDLLSREGKEFVSTVWRGKREQDRDHVPSEEVWRNRRD